MAQALNKQYVQTVRKIRESMPPPQIDPLISYNKYLEPYNNLSFTFECISMSQLRTVISSMKTTSTTADDKISIWMIKQARSQLEPLLLHLVNRTILTGIYPTSLKISKIIPIEKMGKEPTNSSGWRPINLVNTISKIIERVLLSQILKYLDYNKLVGHIHHGSVRDKSTQTLVTEIYSQLVENFSQGEESVLLQLDQSKAFDVVRHDILLRKIKALGFKNNALRLMENYLSNRKQYVHISGFDSDWLDVGPQSVTQGSTLSCTLFLIFILDMNMMFHETNHPPDLQLECVKKNMTENPKTFVDDNTIIVKKMENKTLSESVLQTMNKVKTYMESNQLELNESKTTVLVVSRDKSTRDNFAVTLGGKCVTHSKAVKLLGNIISEDLTWEGQVKNYLIPNLKNWIRTLKMTSCFLKHKFKKQYIEAIFKSKLNFGMENWGGGCPKKH